MEKKLSEKKIDKKKVGNEIKSEEEKKMKKKREKARAGNAIRHLGGQGQPQQSSSRQVVASPFYSSVLCVWFSLYISPRRPTRLFQGGCEPPLPSPPPNLPLLSYPPPSHPLSRCVSHLLSSITRYLPNDLKISTE